MTSFAEYSHTHAVKRDVSADNPETFHHYIYDDGTMGGGFWYQHLKARFIVLHL